MGLTASEWAGFVKRPSQLVLKRGEREHHHLATRYARSSVLLDEGLPTAE
jgi:hypothetical protein